MRRARLVAIAAIGICRALAGLMDNETRGFFGRDLAPRLICLRGLIFPLQLLCNDRLHEELPRSLVLRCVYPAARVIRAGSDDVARSFPRRVQSRVRVTCHADTIAEYSPVSAVCYRGTGK